ncbi:unannotated protein [freshwater metagenome]|uniref:Unannotated protein n=1 Tax=freshwater metagenome TaxID=449393 RepID=A0A6J7E295_9ZZZZ
METAAPARSEIVSARRIEGLERKRSAVATVETANAPATPSLVIGPVVQSTTPLDAINAAASSAALLVVSRMAQR